MIEKLTQPILDVIKYGRFLLSTETVEAGQQMASIQHYGTKEAPLDGEPLERVEQIVPTVPDYTNQLDFHQQELTRGAETMPEGQLAYHRQKVAVLGGLVIERAAA